MSTPLPPLSVENEVIPNFPTLGAHDYVFADNAGGSAVLASSIAAITAYLIHSNVQLGGSYPYSVKAGEQVAKGPKATAELVNVEGGYKQIVLGSSTTQLASNLGYAATLGEGLFEKGDEIIVTAADHEGESRPSDFHARPDHYSVSQCRAMAPSCRDPRPLHQILAAYPAGSVEPLFPWAAGDCPSPASHTQDSSRGLHGNVQPARALHARQGGH